MSRENDWSVLRRAVQRGYDLAYHRDSTDGYEVLSAKMDVIAHELTPLLPPAVAPDVSEEDVAALRSVFDKARRWVNVQPNVYPAAIMELLRVGDVIERLAGRTPATLHPNHLNND